MIALLKIIGIGIALYIMIWLEEQLFSHKK